MRIAALLAFAAVAAPAAAQTPVAVGEFRSVQLVGGGEVTVRHGPAQRVTLLSGTTDMTSFTVGRDGELRIQACTRRCADYRLRVEIVTPRIDGLAVTGGGRLLATGGFPAQRELALAVRGGGALDSRAIPADGVNAAVRGGGSVRASATGRLNAAVSGGGSITYWGDPAVSRAISGGGSVTRGR